MLVTRFDPFRELRELENRFLRTYSAPEKEGAIAGFTPSVNIREGEFAYHVDVDLPGVAKEDIKVDVKEGKLTVSGERNFKAEVKEEDYYKVETSFGKFSRSFALPENADVENIDAACDNGVLEVVIPKLADKTNTRSIAVK
ncbi:MAG: Hsp20/alpha crystallin family protein [Campylobacterales bacterium]|nr:Hsp20/alpha crystallin family protein [Campylobacterales bacterium]